MSRGKYVGRELRQIRALNVEIRDDRWYVFQRWGRGKEGGFSQDVGPVRKGEWTDWVVQAYWSGSDGGYVKVWRNGEIVYERSGRSLYERSENIRFKLGVYVWPWKRNKPSPESSSPRVIYHDEIRIGGEDSSYEAVKPR